MKVKGEDKGIQHSVTRVAALSRAKSPKMEELAEARQDLQQARLERDIKREATNPNPPYVRLSEARRKRLAKMLYPEGWR
jgi:hypothetical protein